MRNLICLLLFGSVCLAAAQTREEVLSKVIGQYTAPKPLQYSLTYNLYKSDKAKKVFQTYSGSYFKSSGSELYMKIDNTEYFINKELSVQIDHKEKAMLLSSPGGNMQGQLDINELLKQFKKGSFHDRKSHWEVELLALPFSNLPYSRILLFIGKDHFIQKQQFFYSSAIDFSEDYKKQDLQHPILEVIFSRPSRKAIDKSRFDTSKYFSIEKRKIKLLSAYTNYQIIDKRK